MEVVTHPNYIICNIVPSYDTTYTSNLGIYGNKFNKLRKKLQNTVSKLDKYENDKQFNAFMRNLYPYDKFKYIIQKQLHIPYATNAWIKTYQLFYKIKDSLIKESNIRAFYNANAPGASSHAGDYFFNHILPAMPYQWVASSYIGGDGTLEDSYGLIKLHRNKWLMDDKNNGDVTKVANLLNFKEKIYKKFDKKLANLYFSDIAVDVKGDYQNEELLELKEVYGQNLCALITLDKGGIMIVKQRSFLLPFNVWMITALSKMFKKFSIHKPSTSRSFNSEVYLVGIDYKGITNEQQVFMFNVLENFNKYKNGMVLPTPISLNIVKQVYESADLLTNRQIDALIICIQTYEKYKGNMSDFTSFLLKSQNLLRDEFIHNYNLF